jgi:hypothetical protein
MFFGQPPSRTVLLGGAFVVVGGAIMSTWPDPQPPMKEIWSCASRTRLSADDGSPFRSLLLDRLPFQFRPKGGSARKRVRRPSESSVVPRTT